VRQSAATATTTAAATTTVLTITHSLPQSINQSIVRVKCSNMFREAIGHSVSVFHQLQTQSQCTHTHTITFCICSKRTNRTNKNAHFAHWCIRDSGPQRVLVAVLGDIINCTDTLKTAVAYANEW